MKIDKVIEWLLLIRLGQLLGTESGLTHALCEILSALR